MKGKRIPKQRKEKVLTLENSKEIIPLLDLKDYKDTTLQMTLNLACEDQNYKETNIRKEGITKYNISNIKKLRIALQSAYHDQLPC